MTTQRIHTYCSMCTSRCGVVATVRDGVLTKVRADPDHPNGCICVKGAAAPEIVYSADRVQYPMVRTHPKGDPDPGWRRVSWDEALEMVATRLSAIKARYGAEAVVFSHATPAGSATADFNAWYDRLANAFGSPNSLSDVNICTWNRVWGAKHTYGVPTPAPHYDHARCILLWGTNPEVSHPAAAMRIRRAQTRGARLIVIDPRRHSLAQKADVWLGVRPGSDGILALAMIHVLLDEGLYDAEFVRDWTTAVFLVRQATGQLLAQRDLGSEDERGGLVVWDQVGWEPVVYHPERGYERAGVDPALFGSFAITLADRRVVTCRPALQMLAEIAAEYAPERSADLTWVSASEVRRAARLFATEKPSCHTSWVGLEQHRQAGQTNRAVCCFYALTGQFDQRGSNVLFGATPTQPEAGFELLSAEQVGRRLGLGEHPLGPQRDPGMVVAADVYRAILTGQPYPVKAMVLFGTDPLLRFGDPMQGRAALEKLEFYVHMDMFANPSAMLADVLLPASTCWEREALMPAFRSSEDGATWAQFRQAIVEPVYESRSDMDVIFELARRMDLGPHFFEGDVEAAYNHELAPSGLSVQQLREHPGGMRVAAQTRYQKYMEIDPDTNRPQGFITPTRRLEIYSTTFSQAGYAPLPVWEGSTDQPVGPSSTDQNFPLLLTFSRLIQFCDEQHRNIPRLRRQAPHPLVEIHPTTAANLNIQDGEWVVVETESGKVQLKAKLSVLVDPRAVSTQYGWWQACRELDLPGYDPLAANGANANVLISNAAVDSVSSSVQHRAVACRVRKIAALAPSAAEQGYADPGAI
ncbi:MAG: molybdopterin-dependent oxidoreductase [Chloroflexota bacterium]|nr:molybdopterin-dependent oxidoreductase [Chloroflexota bacterium]